MGAGDQQGIESGSLNCPRKRHHSVASVARSAHWPKTPQSQRDCGSLNQEPRRADGQRARLHLPGMGAGGRVQPDQPRLGRSLHQSAMDDRGSRTPHALRGGGGFFPGSVFLRHAALATA